MLQYQLLCDIEQALNFLEVRVLVDLQIRQVIWSKMNGCFHWRRHEHSQHMCLKCFNWECWVTCCNLVYFMFWNFVSWGCCRHTSPCASRVWRFLQIKQFPGIWTVSFFLSPRLRTFGFWILGDPHKSPSACIITLSFIVVPRIDQMSHVVRRMLLRAPRAAQHQVYRFCLRGNCWSWLCHRWTFTGSRFLTSLWHGALLFPDRIRKKNAEVSAREHRETHHVEQTEKVIPLVTRKTPLVRMSAGWFFGVNIFDLDLGFKNCFCRTTNQAQLCGFLTRVLIVGLRPLILILITASLSSDLYNWDSFWEECVLVGT